MIGGLGKNWSRLYDCWSTKGITQRLVNTETLGWQPEGYRKFCVWWNGREIHLFWHPIDNGCLSRTWSGRTRTRRSNRNIFEMVRLKVPIITIIVGEGARWCIRNRSGRSRLYAWKHLVFCDSPESCSSMESWEYKEIAAEALKLTLQTWKGKN
jgi:hypothetical protein